MRPYLMTGQYDILIIKDLSRFSRRNSRGLVELEDLRDAGVRIVAIGGQHRLSDARRLDKHPPAFSAQ